MEIDDPLNVYMTPEETAEYLKITPRDVHALIKEHRIPCLRLTQKLKRIPFKSLMDTLERQTTFPNGTLEVNHEQSNGHFE